MPRSLTRFDNWLAAADNALRTMSGASVGRLPYPGGGTAATSLNDEERALSGALMRVNHVGEVCAQALYQAQAMVTADPALRSHFQAAAREETEHLAWTQRRLQELGCRPSLLNPLWYAGAFGIGLAAGRFSDRVSLGFVVETERQVERHLQEHLERLPANDVPSRAVVRQMQEDEARHAMHAEQAGGAALPAPVRGLMRLAAKVMTTVAHRV